MKKILTNKLVLLSIYILVTVLIEMYYFLIQYGQMFPVYFFYDFCIILILGCITCICGKYKGQMIASCVFMIAQIIIANVNFGLSRANGDIFSWEMLSLLIEAVKVATGGGGFKFVNFVHLLVLIPIAGAGLYGMILYYKKRITKQENYKKEFSGKRYLQVLGYSSLVALLCVSFNLITVVTLSNQKDSFKVSSDAYLFDSQFIKQEAVRKFGSFGYYYINAKSNLKSHFMDNEKKVTTLRNYLEQGNEMDTSNYYTGVSEGNNLIYILFETGEWFGLHEDITPNLYSLMYGSVEDKNGNQVDGGITLTNYHSKSQTNISEAQSLFGSYPLAGILNYDYTKNYYPNTLPNKFRSVYPNAIINSYHSNVGTYYNRYESHEHYGFDQHFAADEMQLEQSDDKSWIRLDSEMFGKCLSSSVDYVDTVEPIVPNEHEEPFMSYIASFSTHGPYTERESMIDNINFVKETVTEPFTTIIGNTIDLKDEVYGEEVTNYLASARDFDLGIGKLIDDLKEKDELDKTTIMIFSDHYAYYSNLSAVTKGFDGKVTTESKIYNVPAILFDTKLKTKMENNMVNDSNIAYQLYNGKQLLTYNKYCGNIDFTPTLLNMFNLDYNKHDYTGRDIFSEETSFVLSRYGGLFNDKFYTSDGETIDNLPTQFTYYKEEEEAGVAFEDIKEIPGLTKIEYLKLKEEIEQFFEEASEFLVRQDYINMIYKNDYYGKLATSTKK